jgi:hypothetical protein
MNLQPAAEPAGWETLSAFARRIGRDKSTISRQIRAGKIPQDAVREQGGRVLVHIQAGAAALQANVNSLLSRAEAPATLGLVPPPAPADTDDPLEARAPSRPPPSLNMAATAEKAIKAQLLRLELEQRRGRLLDKAEVYEAFLQVGLLLRAKLENRRQALAQDMVGITDQAELAARLAQADDEALLALSGEFQRLVDLTARESLPDAA